MQVHPAITALRVAKEPSYRPFVRIAAVQILTPRPRLHLDISKGRPHHPLAVYGMDFDQPAGFQDTNPLLDDRLDLEPFDVFYAMRAIDFIECRIRERWFPSIAYMVGEGRSNDIEGFETCEPFVARPDLKASHLASFPSRPFLIAKRQSPPVPGFSDVPALSQCQTEPPNVTMSP